MTRGFTYATVCALTLLGASPVAPQPAAPDRILEGTLTLTAVAKAVEQAKDVYAPECKMN